MTIELPEEVLSRVRAEAARRGISVESLIAESVIRSVAEPAVSMPPRKFALDGVGASSGTRFARDADELLAEGFGKD